MIVKAVLATGMQTLGPNTDTPRLDAQLLLSATLGKDRSWLTAHNDAAVLSQHADTFLTLCRRRACGMPVAYLTGRAGFYGREFTVNDRVLIPRPETEHLIEAARKYLRQRRAGNLRLLDVGTGCGAIAVTMAAECRELTVDATDISGEALHIAQNNAESHGVEDRCNFFWGDLIDPVSGNQYDAVIANLPYVPSAALPAAPDPVSFEPASALDGGRDGLHLYRRLLAGVAGVMSQQGALFMEAAPPIVAKLRELATAAFPDCGVQSFDDFSGRARYVCVYRQGGD